MQLDTGKKIINEKEFKIAENAAAKIAVFGELGSSCVTKIKCVRLESSRKLGLKKMQSRRMFGLVAWQKN